MAKNRVVAMDIGTNSAKIVQLERSATAVHLVNASVVTYPNKDDRQTVTELVRQLWTDLGSAPTGILSIFNRNKTGVGVALPRFLVSTKRLANLPMTTDEQLSEVVAIAAETELPFRVEEAIFTYHDVRRTAESTSVELVSTRRDTVMLYMDMLEQVGVSPSAVTPSMVAIAAVARLENEGKNTTGKNTIIADVGSELTDFCFMQDGSLQFSRSFLIGGKHLSELVMTALNVDVETAEQEKRHLSAREAPTNEWVTRFLGELQRSIAAASREIGNVDSEQGAGGYGNNSLQEAETELWLCGGGSRVPELVEVCESQLNIPTRLWNPLDTFEQRTNMEIRPDTPAVQAMFNEWGDTFAVPLGVGLGLLNPTECVSLLPKEAAETLTQSARQRRLLTTGALGGLLIVGLAFGGITLQRSHQLKVASLDSQIANFSKQVVDAKAQLGRELALTDMLTHHISPLDILHMLSQMFGDRTQVAWANFNMSNLDDPAKAQITFNLKAASHQAINALLSTLDRSEVFTNVQPGEVTTIAENRKTIFQVQVRCNLETSSVKTFAKSRHPLPKHPVLEIETDKNPEIVPPASETLEKQKKVERVETEREAPKSVSSDSKTSEKEILPEQSPMDERKK